MPSLFLFKFLSESVLPMTLSLIIYWPSYRKKLATPIVENCLRELKVKRWRQKTNNREECAFVAEADEIHKGKSNQGIHV
jgi:hypothetical protein